MLCSLHYCLNSKIKGVTSTLLPNNLDYYDVNACNFGLVLTMYVLPG